MASGVDIIPDLPQFPANDVLVSLSSSQQELCIATFTSVLDLYLRLKREKFRELYQQNPDLQKGLLAIVRELSTLPSNLSVSRIPSATTLRSNVLLVLYRISCDSNKFSQALLEWHFLGDLCYLYGHHPTMKQLLDNVQRSHKDALSAATSAANEALKSALSAGSFRNTDSVISSRRILSFLKFVPGAAKVFLIGSDLLDLLATSYQHFDLQDKRTLPLIFYLGLESILSGDDPNHSLLFDILFDFKATCNKKTNESESYLALVTTLVTDTPFLNHFGRFTSPESSARAADLLNFLKSIRAKSSFSTRSHYSSNTRVDAPSKTFHGEAEFVHQIRELLPHISFVEASHLNLGFAGNMDRAVAHFLEHGPIHLSTDNKWNDIIGSSSLPSTTSTSLSERRNVFDDDPFDRLAISTSNLLLEGGVKSHTSPSQLPHPTTSSKAAIYSALSAFDADDDEHDDTYDLEDVGGTVDTPHPEGDADADLDAGSKAFSRDQMLFGIFATTPERFQRTSVERRSSQRKDLKDQTGMTDEALEGWAVMIQKQPQRYQRLLAQSHDSRGNEQPALERTSWRDNEESSEDSKAVSDSRHPHRGRARSSRDGRTSFRASRSDGAPTSRLPEGRQAQVSRQRKEVNKGSRANHNRRDQRARKIARAGFSE